MAELIVNPADLPPLLPPGQVDRPKAPPFPDPQRPFADYVNELTTAWRFTRLTYPGWLITPHQNRRALWDSTSYWVGGIFKNVRLLDRTAAVKLTFELNWRLERCLVPLFVDWVREIEALIDQRNSLGNQRCSEEWVGLAFAVAREAREDFDVIRWQRWMGFLQDIVSENPDWAAHWQFERCVESLWRLDERELRRRIEDWQLSPDLLVWQLRRAAILGEIGDFAEAEALASATLRRVRAGLRAGRERIDLLSLEGWAMKLLSSVQQGYRSGEGVKDFDSYRDRWFQLAGLRCDPWPVIESLDAELGGPAPQLHPTKQEILDFDYRRSRTVRYGGNYLSAFVPAFARLRLFEEAGIPVRVGVLTLATGGVENACRWVFPFAPLWTSSMLIRAGKTDVLGQVFSRAVMASLTETEVGSFRDWLIPAVTGALAGRPLNPDEQQRSPYVLQALVDLLSMLTVRLNSQELDQVLKLAIELHLRGRVDRTLHDSSRRLFRRAFEAASHEQLCGWLPALARVPLVSDDEVRNQIEPFIWNDPFEEIQPEWLDRCKDQQLSIPQIVVDSLLSSAASGQAVVRNRAINRLWLLREAGLLTSSQRRKYGVALWSRRDGATGLPANTNFRPHAFLTEPSPDPKLASSLVRKFLISQPSVRLLRVATDNGGKKTYNIALLKENRFLSEVLAATKSMFFHSDRQTRLIDWSRGEVHKLLEKAIEWWDADKEALQHAGDWGGVEDALQQMVPFLQTVILPRLPADATAAWGEVDRVLRELRDLRLSEIQALPAVLVSKPERAQSVADDIRASLRRATKESVEAASECILTWTALHSRKLTPKVPGDLLDELCNRIANRQQPSLQNVISNTEWLVRHCPTVISDFRLQRLYTGLEYLLEETRIPSKHEINDDLSKTPLPVAERPIYRLWSARLAAALYRFCERRKRKPPKILEEWRTRAVSDSLPEVRKSWTES